jgi:hypothetical protein
MRVPDKQGRKEVKKTNYVSVFSFFLLISLCSSVIFHSMSPALADDKESLPIILVDGDEIYIQSGSSHTFLQDYQLYIEGYQLSIKGKDTKIRIWIELSRKGVPLKDAIVTEGSQFVYSQNSTEILNLTVSMIYEGSDGVLVKFSPVYQYLDSRLPMPQTPAESIANASYNISSINPELETQAEGFDTPLIFLGLGTVFLATGFFAGKRKKR